MRPKFVIALALVALAIPAGAQINVGPANPAAVGPGAYYTFFSDGLIFDVFAPTTLVSVDVDPQNAGTVVVNLMDNALNVIQTTSVPVAAGGLQTIIVNFPLTPGTGYRLDATGTTTGSLYRNTSGAVYPYSAPGTLDITGPINALAGFYYFFYNWFIGTAVVAPYPGTPMGDLQLATGVNAAPTIFPWLTTATALDTITLKMASPAGTYDNQPFVLLAQPFTSGFAPPPTLPALGLWLDLSSPYVLLVSIDPFLTQVLDPGGTELNFIMPFGFAGQTFRFQGACPTPALSITDAYEIQVM